MKYIVFVLLLLPYGGISQSRTKLERERNAIIKKIDQTNKILVLTEKKSSNALKKLNLIDSKIKERQALIDNYSESLQQSKNKSQKLTYRKDSLETSLNDNLKKYKKLLEIQLRKKILDNKWMYVFSAHSLSDALLRYRYYEQYKSYFKTQMQQILSTSNEYQDQISKLSQEQINATSLLQSQKDNYKKLEKQKNKKKAIVSALNKDKIKLAKTLKNAKKKREKLNIAIEKVILANLSSSNNNNSATGFKSNKKKIPWPLGNSVITSKFGIQNHANISSVKISNNGIDLSSSSSTQVKAVYSGTAIAIVDAPNNGIMIILQHGSYYSVYSNLSNASIKKGDNISQNKMIGSIPIGKSLHFELWHNKTKLNPEQWLK